MLREVVFHSHHVCSRGLRSAAEFLSPVAALRVPAKAPRQASQSGHSTATIRLIRTKTRAVLVKPEKKLQKNMHSTGQALSVVDGELVDVDARIK